jgi:hypothetical protein
MALPVPQTHVFAAVCHGVQPGVTLACAKPTDMASAIRATAEVFSMLVPPDVVMALEIPEAAWLGVPRVEDAVEPHRRRCCYSPRPHAPQFDPARQKTVVALPLARPAWQAQAVRSRRVAKRDE